MNAIDPTIRDTCLAYVEQAARRDARHRAETLVTRTDHDEVCAVDARVETVVSRRSESVGLLLADGPRASYVTACAASEPATVLRHAAELLDVLPAREPLAAPATYAAHRACVCDTPRPLGPAGLEALVTGGPQAAPGATLDVRAWAQTKETGFACGEGEPLGYRAVLFGALVRVTHREGRGRGHATRFVHDRDEATFRRLLTERVLPETRARAELFAAPGTGPLPTGPTVLDSAVAAHVVALAATALLADSVAQKRSRLAGRLGERVAAPGLSLADDPRGDGPLHASFDDEGVATARRELVVDGRLVGLLSDRAHAGTAAAAAGSAWKPWPDAPPRPAISNLRLGLTVHEPAPAVHLRITDITGGHIANSVTGDFSFGACGTVTTAAGDVHGVTGLSVAGNAFDILRRCRAADPHTWWHPQAGGFVGCPDLLVEGLVVTR